MCSFANGTVGFARQRIAVGAHEIGRCLDEVGVAVSAACRCAGTGSRDRRCRPRATSRVARPGLRARSAAPADSAPASGGRACVTSGCAVEGRLPIRTLPIGVPAVVRMSLASWSVLASHARTFGAMRWPSSVSTTPRPVRWNRRPPHSLLELADLPADVRLARAIGHGHLAQAAELGGVDEELPGGVIHRASVIPLSVYLKCADLASSVIGARVRPIIRRHLQRTSVRADDPTQHRNLEEIEMKALDLRGLVPAPVTPFTRDGDVDHAAIQRLGSWLGSFDGVKGLVVLGHAGEGTFLTPGRAGAVIATFVKSTDGRIPVIAGITLEGTKVAARGSQARRRRRRRGRPGLSVARLAALRLSEGRAAGPLPRDLRGKRPAADPVPVPGRDQGDVQPRDPARDRRAAGRVRDEERRAQHEAGGTPRSR